MTWPATLRSLISLNEWSESPYAYMIKSRPCFSKSSNEKTNTPNSFLKGDGRQLQRVYCVKRKSSWKLFLRIYQCIWNDGDLELNNSQRSICHYAQWQNNLFKINISPTKKNTSFVKIGLVHCQIYFLAKSVADIIFKNALSQCTRKIYSK